VEGLPKPSDGTIRPSPGRVLSHRDQATIAESLAHRVWVPCCPSTGLEPNTCADRACWMDYLKPRVDAYGAGKYSAGPLAEGCEPALLISRSQFRPCYLVSSRCSLLIFAFATKTW